MKVFVSVEGRQALGLGRCWNTLIDWPNGANSNFALLDMFRLSESAVFREKQRTHNGSCVKLVTESEDQSSMFHVKQVQEY